MLQSPTPSNDEIRGDWNNLKGTDYHLVYVVWLLLRRRASQVAFYRGNDLLATPVPPVRLHQDQEPQLAIFAHQVGDVEDLWIQLKSGFAAWTVSSLLSGNLLPNFLVNAFTSETAGRRWRVALVTPGHVETTKLRAFVADPQRHRRYLETLSASLAKATETLTSSQIVRPPLNGELEALAWQVLAQLADTEPKTLGELRAEVETELAFLVPDRGGVMRLGDALHGALLRDAALGPTQARVYDLNWLSDAAGRRVIGTGPLDTDPVAACARINDRARARNWNSGLFVQRRLQSAILEDFLQQRQTVLPVVGPSGSGKSWLLSEWAQVDLSGQIRLLVKGADLTTRPRLQRLVADAVSAETTLDMSDAAVMRRLNACHSGAPVLLVDDLRPWSGVEVLRDALIQLIADCDAWSWKLVLSCSDALWRMLRMDESTVAPDVYQTLSNGESAQSIALLQPLSDGELREFLRRRLDPGCAEASWHKLRETRFGLLRRPYLLERYVETYRDQLCGSTIAPLPGIRDLLTSRLDEVIRTVASKHSLAPSDILPVLEALALALQQARPSGLSYAHTRELFAKSLGPAGDPIIADLRAHGVLTTEGPIDFAEEPLGWALLFREFGASARQFRKVMPHLIPERDAGFVEMAFAQLGDAAPALAEELLSQDSRWSDALPSAFLQVPQQAAGLQLLASLATLDNRRKRMMVALDGARAVGDLAVSNRLALEWLLQWYLSDRAEERQAGQHGLFRSMSVASRRVEAAMRLRIARAERSSADVDSRVRNLRGALSPLLGIANAQGARVAERVLNRVDSMAERSDSTLRNEFVPTVDEVRGAIAVCRGDLRHEISRLRDTDADVRFSAVRRLSVAALDAPESVAGALCDALQSETNAVVTNELLWSAHAIIRVAPERLLDILENDPRYFQAASFGYTLVLLGQLADYSPKRVERLLPVELAFLPVEQQVLVAEVHAYAWWRLAQRLVDARQVLDRLSSRAVDHIPAASRMLMRRANIVAKLASIALESIPREVFDVDPDAWPLVYGPGDRRRPPFLETSAFCRKFAPRLHQHADSPELRDRLIDCLIDSDGGAGNLPPWSELAKGRYAAGRQCLEMLSELLRFEPDAAASLQRLQADWYGLFLASELLEAGARDASIVAYAEQACAATARSISAEGTDQRERCMAGVAAVQAIKSDPVLALQQHRAQFGNNLLAQGARSRALAELASSHISQAVLLLEHSIRDEDDLGTLFTLTGTAKTWWQYLIARPYARMFHPRRISVAEARSLCEEMLAGLHGLPSSDVQAEHVALYGVILDRLNGGGSLLPQLQSRTGLLASSHSLALEVLAQADAGLDDSRLQRLLHDRRGWLHSMNRGIGESDLSFGSGIYLLYIFPAVRLASLAAGRQIGHLPDPASTFMRLRIAGQDLVHKTRSRFGYVPEPTPTQLRELLEPLLEFVQTAPGDERVWATIGDLRLRLEQFEEAKGALTAALSCDWSDPITRKGALYDLGCVYARTRQEQDCRIVLTEWANMGTYANEREHVMNDSDLESVRKARWFRDLFEQAT